ncbi:MAG: hypothetical protein ABIO70_03070 [Pseudomonadota bacterium]
MSPDRGLLAARHFEGDLRDAEGEPGLHQPAHEADDDLEQRGDDEDDLLLDTRLPQQRADLLEDVATEGEDEVHGGGHDHADQDHGRVLLELLEGFGQDGADLPLLSVHGFLQVVARAVPIAGVRKLTTSG